MEASRRRTARVAAAAVLAAACLAVAAVAAAADQGTLVRQVRCGSHNDRTRVVLDLDGSASYEVRRDAAGLQVTVHVRNSRSVAAAATPVADGLVAGVRCGQFDGGVDVVIDLLRRGDFRSFSLPAGDGRPDRIVIDVVADGAAAANPVVRATGPATAAPEPRDEDAAAPFVVVLDPGHGGADPGAVRSGLQEKDVVLDVALEAARLIDALPGYRAVLTRQGDTYPDLARRVTIAGEAGGGVFVSIHCNTHRRAEVAGMEVYFLSLQGATDREAQELADKENAAQIVGLGREDDDAVVGILMDLRMSRVLHESSRLADAILASSEGVGTVPVRAVKQARFQVLGQLAMPAALVELAYLSNPADRRRLGDADVRRRLAAEMVQGIVDWRRDLQAGQVLAAARPDAWPRSYEVRRGDSLWSLARRHGTTVQEISRRNDLRSAGLVAGQMLRLPPTGRTP